ncbi:hypothetical protein BpJC7_02120 [Weizmannia acidilactici]|uniref:Acyl-CoA thioesterase n=1 Tax=Weizmannia acidilactici TaxID=2607726 RepID=A0A5J4JCF3_9BACI|nr:thioesterase family protein [Weizmannia acidilactici]GER68909.1 hypothetical protein BpJC7_02120 [Weizmannia acidilactici]GER73910.1 hypothetical protein BpPP18_19770 [Weizmannia acidilactici]
MHIAKTDIQLSYADTDMMGVIYHGNYIKWLELGRSQFVEDAGYDYLDMEKAGYYAPVYHLDITYKKSIRFGDQVSVLTWVEENGRSRTVYGFKIVNGQNEICAEGTTTHIIVKKDTFRPVSFAKVFPEWFHKYEEMKKQK